ncbi:MAG TPA: GAP family protein [Actinomycetota bacterium]|nr:GAP family protein [Actinomycetota bacterium]
MLTEAIGNVLPAAAAVALSPIPIVAVVLVLGSPRARTAGPAFALGWVAGLGVVSVTVTLVAGGAPETNDGVDTGISWGLATIGLAFLVMAARQWRKRPRPGEQPQMPAWMATVGSVSWPRALVLGLALSAANPKNLALTLAASASIAQAGLETGETLIADAVFVAIGSVTVVGAVLFALVAPRVATRPLDSVRRFMTDNNATIMMVLLLVLGLKILGDAIGGP